MANFATLDSLKKEDEDKEKKGNAYYAGGARGAGQGGRFVPLDGTVVPTAACWLAIVYTALSY